MLLPLDMPLAEGGPAGERTFSCLQGEVASLRHSKGARVVARPSIDLLQGSLDVIVLQTLSWQPMHGFGIARWIQRVTDGGFQVEEGSLYPALYRLENK